MKTLPRALVLALGVLGLTTSVSSAITGGAAAVDRHGVVALLVDGRVHCSGILVRPRIVLTAAHCLTGGRPDAVLLESSQGLRRTSKVQRVWRHPAYSLGRAEVDLGLLLLSEPGSPPYLSINTQPFTNREVGSEVRIAGFGRAATTDLGPLDKREGTAILDSVSPGTLSLRAAPSLACGGDSGGPVLRRQGQDAIVVGIISNGDHGCARRTEAVRIDAHARELIEPLIAKIESRSGSPGASCVEDVNCASGRCLAPEDAPDFGYCSSGCSNDADCPSNMHCAASGSHPGTCVLGQPSPGAIGAPCAQDSDCQFGMCAAFPQHPHKMCSALCFSGASASCPADTVCRQVADSSEVSGCMRPARSSRRSSGAESSVPGCAAAPTSASRLVDGLCVALAAALATRARRRRATTQRACEAVFRDLVREAPALTSFASELRVPSAHRGRVDGEVASCPRSRGCGVPRRLQ